MKNVFVKVAQNAAFKLRDKAKSGVLKVAQGAWQQIKQSTAQTAPKATQGILLKLKQGAKAQVVISVLFAAFVGFGVNACETLGSVANDLKPGTKQQKSMAASQYPAFTKAFMVKMPKLEGGFWGTSGVSFSENGDAMSYKVDELKRNNITNDWGRKGHAELYQKALSDYLNSGVSETNKQYQAFVKTCAELGLSVKKYRNDLLIKSRIVLPRLNTPSGTKHEIKRNLDYVYLAFDKSNQIKVVFTYEHDFFFGNNGIIHDSMWALIWYGSAAMRAQQAFDNDWLSKYEVK